MLLAFCTASPGSLRRPAGPARTASGAMALLSTYLFDACRLSNLVAGGRPAWRAARWQPAQYALDSDFCLAALTAAASGAGASRLASPVLSTPATRVSARRPRRPRRARMARRSSGAFPAGCAGQSASLRAPPPAARGRHRRCCREHCRRVRHHRLSSSPISPTPLAARRRPAFLLPAARRLLLPPHDRQLPVLRRLLPLRRQRLYYRGTVALGRTGLIPAAHVYEGGLRKVGMPGMSGD